MLEVTGLSKSYGKQKILTEVSFTAAPGACAGIIGSNGCGKTTLLSILAGAVKADQGSIRYQGQEAVGAPAVFARAVAYVPQENFLFSDTLEENIAFGLEQRISEYPELRKSIRRAAKAACIHDNIVEFPEEYRTLVGERGVTLSGGQKQRSSIARALLMDASVLILDDSLSAVDTDTEEQILENLMKLRKGKTTIVVAHRISTLQKANHIAVLTEGELTEYGTHEELLELGGFYAHIYEKQQLEQELTAI